MKQLQYSSLFVNYYFPNMNSNKKRIKNVRLKFTQKKYLDINL